MVGADRLSSAPDVRNVVAGSHELCASEREQIPKLRVRPMIDDIIRLHGEEFALFVGCELDVHKKGRTLPSVSHVLEVIVPEETGLARRQGRCSNQSLHGLSLIHI